MLPHVIAQKVSQERTDGDTVSVAPVRRPSASNSQTQSTRIHCELEIETWCRVPVCLSARRAASLPQTWCRYLLRASSAVIRQTTLKMASSSRMIVTLAGARAGRASPRQCEFLWRRLRKRIGMVLRLLDLSGTVCAAPSGLAVSLVRTPGPDGPGRECIGPPALDCMGLTATS